MSLGVPAGIVTATALARAMTGCDPGLSAGAVAAGQLVVVPVLIVVHTAAFALVFSAVYRGTAPRVGAALAFLAAVLCLAVLALPAAVLFLSGSTAPISCDAGSLASY